MGQIPVGMLALPDFHAIVGKQVATPCMGHLPQQVPYLQKIPNKGQKKQPDDLGELSQ